MNTETVRIADQLQRAFGGEAWHGPPLRELLTDVTWSQANARPLASAHTIWEIVLHIESYVSAALEAAEGGVMPKIYQTPQDWRIVSDAGEASWTSTVKRLFAGGERLAAAIERFPDQRLLDVVPGREYHFYQLFHGVVQHSLFHGGQIAILKRAVQST
jgi:hypothetical protein